MHASSQHQELMHQHQPTTNFMHQTNSAIQHHPMHSWYGAGYQPHHQVVNGQVPQTAPSPWCMQDDQQVWLHHHTYPYACRAHSEFPSNGNMMYYSSVDVNEQNPINPHTHHQLPSPAITLSGSDVSSPGTSNESPQTRSIQPRSPYRWLKSSQRTPNSSEAVSASLVDQYTAQESVGKTRTKDKYRVVYTDHQRVELEKEFYYSRYITIRRKSELANNLGLSERQVKIWFQNRRAKERKQVKKREECSQKDNMTLIEQQILHHQGQSIIPGVM